MDAARFDPGRFDRAFGALERRIAAGEMPAAALAVADGGGLVREAAFGTAADGAPVTTRHRFAIASLTKPMTAILVMQLVEEGALTLETPLVRLLPDFRAPPVGPGHPGGETVTIRHLLTHTSGVSDGPVALGEPAPDRNEAAEVMLHRACTAQLSFVPGSAYAYASDGYLLLAEAVRRLDGGISFEASLRRRLLEPLGMSATAFATDLPQNVRAPVHLHGHPPSVAEGWVRWLEAAQHAGGGLWSNLGDLVLLGRAMLAGGTLDGVRVIGRRTLELMTRDATAGFFEPGEARREPHYGLGWGLEGLGGRVHGSARQFGHGGASTSVLWIEPQDGFVLVLLGSMWGLDSNLRDAVIGSIYGALAD